MTPFDSVPRRRLGTQNAENPWVESGAGVRRTFDQTADRAQERWADAGAVGVKPSNFDQAPRSGLGGAISGFIRGLSGAPAIARTPTPLEHPSRPAVAAPAAPMARRSLDGSNTGVRPAVPATNMAMPTLTRLRPGDPNTFTGSGGRTRSAPYDVANSVPAAVPNVRRLDPVFALSSTAPQVQGVTQRTLSTARDVAIDARNDAAEILNPLSTSGELLRRLEISQGGFKGSPSARRAMAEALTGQIVAQNAASSTGQEAANHVLQQGAQAENIANENYVRRRLDADEFNVGSELDRAVLDAKARKPSEAIPLVRSLDGRTSLVREDGTTETLRDEAGNPIRTISAGDVTEKDLFEARNSEIRTVQGSFRPPEERAAQLNAINARPEYQRVIRRLSQPAKPTLEEFLPRARKLNPGMSDEVLLEYYKNRFGGDSS